MTEIDWGEAVGFLGWTRAHEAAKNGTLPDGFDRWELADKDGWTVAHEAAFDGHLPEGFSLWNLRDGRGNTVRDVYNDRKLRAHMEADEERRGTTDG
jgi:hypothetical protein